MIIAILSILVLTFVVWVLNKKLPVKICPICAGVSLTWLWMFIGIFLGKLSITDYQMPAAILAGGTVVGLMSKLEESIKGKFILIWKTIFVVVGFTAVYGLVDGKIGIIIVGLVINVIATFIFKKDNDKKFDTKNLKELKEKMENCC